MRSIKSSVFRLTDRLYGPRVIARRRIILLLAIALLLYTFFDFRRNTVGGITLGTTSHFAENVSFITTQNPSFKYIGPTVYFHKTCN